MMTISTRLRVNALPIAATPVARALYAKRTAERLSLAAAAKQAKLTLATFHRLETSADMRPTVATLLKAAKWIGVDAGDLL